ncbi:MAG: PfkB family carbohydrate kinase [Patescibacteria group bacterium]|nr:PfkB family carbohydrate kinase [Patescibacteria group bacterium]
MILSAGLTPAWQQILVFDAFRYGEVNRAAEVAWCASGKVFNAAIGVQCLGGPSLTLAPVGGAAVPQIEAEFAALGLSHRWTPTGAATRICTTILDRATGAVTELVENGRPLTPDELHAFLHAYGEEAARAEMVLLMGSLPHGTPDTFYRELLLRTPCPAILDFRGDGLLALLDLKPCVVKPNREELAKTLGQPLAGDADLVRAMRELNNRGAEWVVITQGAAAVWATSADAVYRFQPPAISKPVNPIASGDAMAATIAWATRAGRPMPEAIRLGIAAAAQNVRQLLPARLNPETLEAEAAAIPVERP